MSDGQKALCCIGQHVPPIIAEINAVTR